MSMNDIERLLWHEVKVLAKNPKLRKKDIQEWTSGEIAPREDEAVFKDIELLGMKWQVAILKKDDKR